MKKASTKKVVLGKEYKDEISGFSGIAVARTLYLYNCVRVMLSPTKLKADGDFLPDTWFDEPALEIVKPTKSIKRKKSRKVTGGPSRSVAPNRDPV